MIIFVSAIRQKYDNGLDTWTDPTTGQNLGKTKLFNAKDKIRPAYSTKYSGYLNGLSYVPWLDTEGKQKVDEKGNSLTLQDKMEQKWGLPKGYLTNQPSYSYDETKKTYYETMKWELGETTKAFDLSKMDDEIGYYVFLDSHFIANSKKDYLAHKFPKALYYIEDANEDQEIKYSRSKRKTSAYALLEADFMTAETREKLAKVLELASPQAAITPEQCHNLLYEHISTANDLSKFENIVNLLRTQDGREKFEAMYKLNLLVSSRILIEKQGTYTWFRSNGPLEVGVSKEEAIDFLLNPKKAVLVAELFDILKTKNPLLAI